jgi:peptidoglycan/xylan/chitin deacetylase (PgdA/CDA1 family)
MTRDELRALATDPLVTIGSHTVAHAHLVETGPDRAAIELAQSKADLERLLERPVDQFSYPFGARTPALDQQAREAGYRRVYSTAPLPCQSPADFVAGRVAVDPDISLLEFRLKVLGAYRWLAHRNHETTDC